MQVDEKTVRKIARLARLKITDDEVGRMQGELNVILNWVEQLNAVPTDGVEPMTRVLPMQMKKRRDEVTSGGIADDIVANAPRADDHYFVVPKVVE
ncbi:MAG: Asp-tRNA(Asn)/Glu-tRNA(Gln) amidotransferase subunit GatC [Hyphomicrobiaceae bacterium]